MKKFSLLEYTCAFFLFTGTIGIIITKAFLFTSPRIFYVVFFISLVTLIFLLLKKRINFIKNILILTLPAEIALLLVNNLTHKLHWIFDIMSGIWLLLLVFIIIRRYHQNHKKDVLMFKTPKKYTLIALAFLIIVMSVHFSFGFYHLGKAAYVDERLWTYSNEKRIEKYWNNILEMDWKHTRPSDKPGVTLAFISGPSLIFTTPSNFKDTIIDKQAFENMLFAMRLPILIFSTIFLLLFYHILSTLLNPKISLLATVFIGLSPILLGVSRIINPDALSWIFIPLTLLSYLAYLETKNIRWTYATGFLLGLGLLTKYITNLLFPFFFILLFTYPFFAIYSKEQLRDFLRKSLSHLGIVALISLVTFYIFYPGTWVKMDRLLLGTIWSQPFEPIWQIFVIFIFTIILDYFFNKSSIILWIAFELQKIKKFFVILIPLIFLTTILATIYFTFSSTQSINFEHILFSPKTSINWGGDTTIPQAFVTSFYPLIFGISPFALLGVFFALIFLFKKDMGKYSTSNNIVWHLLLFIIIFYAGSLFSTTIPTARYQIILYPLIFIVSGYGWYYFYKVIQKHTKKFSFYFIIITILFFSIYTLFTVKPFYFSYNSPLLPNTQLINPKDMGDGNYEIAQYLNTLPDAKNLNIWSDKRGVCTFFVGNCVSVIRKADFIKNGPNYDYFVISKGREARTVDLSRAYSQMREDYPVRLDLLYTNNPKPIYELNPGNRSVNYIKVIPSENIDVWRGE